MSVSYSESLKLIRSLVKAGDTPEVALATIARLGIRPLTGLEREAEALKSIDPDRIVKIINYIANLKVGDADYDKVSFVRRWTAKYWDKVVTTEVIAGIRKTAYIFKPTTEQAITTWQEIAPSTRTSWYNLSAQADQFSATKEQLFPKQVGIPQTR